MYELTSSDSASFKILSIFFEWGREAPVISIPEKHQQLSDLYPEAGLYERKANLLDRILAIADNVPDKEWEKIPTDMAERYRDYKRNIET